MHIAMVCLPSWGGSSAVAVDLASGLVERGHRVTVVAHNPPPRPVLASLPTGRLVVRPVQVGAHPALAQAGALTVALAGTLLQLLSEDPFDLLHVHYAVPHAMAAQLARAAWPGPFPAVVVSLHGTDASEIAADTQYRPLLRTALAGAQAVTAPSLGLARLAQSHLELPQLPIVQHNFVDLEQFVPAQTRDRRQLDEHFAVRDDSPVLLHVSNFRPVKQAPMLVEQFAALCAHTPCRLLLVGDGPDLPQVREAVAQLGLRDRVASLPPRGDCLPLLQHADVFVLPSRSEGFGLAALEAMACGTPVVATAVGGVPEVVADGIAGLLVDPQEPSALALALRNVLSDRGLWQRLSQGARAVAASEFGRPAGVQRWLELYADLLAVA